ncbi:hypothetical protein B0919_13025 [Hymenobacter sp. CRA2]|nr:hypothetical protein B0919_13025 [Hymenobacter sp. CRA2]
MWYCRVCGLEYDYSPWGGDERTPDHSICECCGIEFGYEDHTISSTRNYRQQWLSAGSKWFDPKRRPNNWDVSSQLGQVPISYR